MILDELTKVQEARYLLNLVLPDDVRIEIVEYDALDFDVDEAVQIDGCYWLFFAEKSIEVPTIVGHRKVDGWVLEGLAGKDIYLRHDAPPPEPEELRKARRLDDIVAEIAGEIAKGRAYEKLYNDAISRENYV